MITLDSALLPPEGPDYWSHQYYSWPVQVGRDRLVLKIRKKALERTAKTFLGLNTNKIRNVLLACREQIEQAANDRLGYCRRHFDGSYLLELETI
jgi:hypothetical protein